MKRHLLLLATLALPTLTQAADPATSFADAAKLHRAGDTAAAVAFWQPLAQKGDPNAAYNLAVIHEHGDGVAKSLPEALKWYRVAAEKGDRASQSRLGSMYLNGEGTPKNAKEGWRWINEHRVAHLHHDHHPHMQAWRKQAAELIRASDMRETLAASRGKSGQIMADLRRRAGTAVDAQPEPRPQLAAGHLHSAQ
jgi:TPR repeat protein